jgi:hypothetical protein
MIYVRFLAGSCRPVYDSCRPRGTLASDTEPASLHVRYLVRSISSLSYARPGTIPLPFSRNLDENTHAVTAWSFFFIAINETLVKPLYSKCANSIFPGTRNQLFILQLISGPQYNCNLPFPTISRPEPKSGIMFAASSPSTSNLPQSTCACAVEQSNMSAIDNRQFFITLSSELLFNSYTGNGCVWAIPAVYGNL